MNDPELNDLGLMMTAICGDLKDLGFNAKIDPPFNILIEDHKRPDDFDTRMLRIDFDPDDSSGYTGTTKCTWASLRNAYVGYDKNHGDYEYADPAFPDNMYNKIEDLSAPYGLRGERDNGIK
jgi:hypothetical protein